MLFSNRAEAGQRLAQHLLVYKREDPIIIALPRGGVPVAYEAARLLGAPLDVRVVRKLGFPGQPELAIGAIADGKKREILLNTEMRLDIDLSHQQIEKEIAAKLEEIRRMEAAFRGHRPAVDVSGRTVIVVDDGIATGATVRVVVKRLRRDKPRKIIVATPVASPEAVELIQKEADDVVTIDTPDNFQAVGQFYDDFSPVPTEEVIRLLDASQEDHQRDRYAANN